MDPKSAHNHLRYLQALRAMTPAQRLAKALELSDIGRRLLADGLRRRNPDLPEAELRRVYLEQIAKCHNRIY